MHYADRVRGWLCRPRGMSGLRLRRRWGRGGSRGESRARGTRKRGAGNKQGGEGREGQPENPEEEGVRGGENAEGETEAQSCVADAASWQGRDGVLFRRSEVAVSVSTQNGLHAARRNIAVLTWARLFLG